MNNKIKLLHTCGIILPNEDVKKISTTKNNGRFRLHRKFNFLKLQNKKLPNNRKYKSDNLSDETNNYNPLYAWNIICWNIL